MSLVDAFSSVAAPVADAVFTNPLVRMGAQAVEIAAQQPVATAATVGALYAYRKFKQFLRQATRESFFMPSIFDSREMMARKLLARGHASMDEILESSFGHWPPRGLDIVAKNPQQVKLVGMFGVTDRTQSLFERLKDYKAQSQKNLGVVYHTMDRRIGIRNFKLSIKPHFVAKSGVGTVLGHEGVHVLQVDHSARAKDIYASSIVDACPDIFQRPTSESLTEECIATHTNMSFVQPHIQKEIYDAGLLRGVEIQARLHQIVAEGYQSWGRMPLNKEELQSGLITMGLIAPAAVTQRLAQSPEHDSVQSVFGKTPYFYPAVGATVQINHVIAALSDTGREMFWEDTLPKLYCDLIEMYGDRPGRERFGFKKNMLLEYRLAKQNETATGGVSSGQGAANDAGKFHGRVYGNGHGGQAVNAAILCSTYMRLFAGCVKYIIPRSKSAASAPEPAP